MPRPPTRKDMDLCPGNIIKFIIIRESAEKTARPFLRWLTTDKDIAFAFEDCKKKKKKHMGA